MRQISYENQHTHLVEYFPALYIPNTDCTVSTTDCDAPATIIPTPRAAQERVLKAGGRAHEDTVYACRRRREWPHVVNDGLRRE